MNFCSLLPAASFIAFEAAEIPSPQLVWRSRDPTISALGEIKYYYSPVAGEIHHESARGCPITVLAERYGGDGVGQNGGGARCGLNGSIQFKGIGQNQLAGQELDYFHSYGGLSISDAILDALWGEVCHYALPYGSCRANSIVLTGSKIPEKFPKSLKPSHTSRAVVARVPKIRPAHFMRAVYFKSDSPISDPQLDAIRTREAVQALPKIAQALGIVGALPSVDEPVLPLENDLLAGVFQRSAKQLAVARRKRIMHGSLTSSNISIDGGWIDFSNTSTLPGYGPIILAKGAPDFLHEEALIHNTIRDLVFSVQKYRRDSRQVHPKFIVNTIELAKEYVSLFNREFQAEMDVQILLLLGLDASFFRHHASAIDKAVILKALGELLYQGRDSPFSILSTNNDYVPVMPEQLSNNQLNEVSCQLVISKCPSESHERLGRLIENLSLRERIVRAFWNIKGHGESGGNGAISDSRVCSKTIRTLLINTDVENLYRTQLYPAIETAIALPENLQEFIDKNIEFARPILDEDRAQIDLSSWANCQLQHCKYEGFLLCGHRLSPSAAIDILSTGCAPKQFIHRLEQL